MARRLFPKRLFQGSADKNLESLVIDLGIVIDLDVMEPLRFVQHQQWRDVLIAGPTTSVVGTSSNVFPGLYYYDPRSQIEHVIMFKGSIDWRQCKLERRIVELSDRKPHLVVGLFGEKVIDKTTQILHAKRVYLGDQYFRNPDAMPSQWEALEVLTRESFRLLPLPEAGESYDWEYTADQCLSTLNKSASSRDLGTKQLLLFFETFASGTSTYDKVQPKEEYKGTAEMICQAGLTSSLLTYAEMKPKHWQAFEELGIKLERTLDKFYDSETGFFQNTYPPKGAEWQRRVIDTWYAFHNLFHVLRAGILANDEHLKTLAHGAIDRMISFVRACNYQIPLYAKISKVDKQGSQDDATVVGFALNPSVLGMYARLLVEAATTYSEDASLYHDEAIQALLNLRRWPVTHIFHQTVQISWAAWASHRLGKLEWRDDFLRCLLLSCYRQGEHAGLFQGCTGLMYPTFRETVEAVTPWIEFLDEAKDIPLRKILDLVLSRAQRFICKDPHAGLPQEGLATVEQPQAGQIGVAIYAAPQVFDLANLQKKIQDSAKY